MNAKQQAQSQVSGIVGMIRAIECDFDRLEELRDGLAFEWSDELAELEEQAGEYADQDEARDAIHATPLSVEVRSGWRSVGEDAGEPEEFRIVLCTGGPRVPHGRGDEPPRGSARGLSEQRSPRAWG